LNDFDLKIQSARINIYNNESGNSYSVTKYGATWDCTCKAYQFCIEPKTCKHIEEVKNVLDNIVPDYDDDEFE